MWYSACIYVRREVLTINTLQTWIKSYPNRSWALVLGSGIALYGIHWAAQPLIEYVFLPQIGFIVMVLGLLFHFGNRYNQGKRILDLGPKVIWIPLLVIVLSVVGSSIVNDPSIKSLAEALFSLFLFSVYLASRDIGRDICYAFLPFVVIVAVSCIVNGILHPGVPTGGIISNYAASAGFMIFGTIVNRGKWQWVLATLVLVAVLATGALEVIFVLGVLGIFLLLRKDVGRRILLPVGIVVVLATGVLSLGYMGTMFNTNSNVVALRNALTSGEFNTAVLDDITTDRWTVAVTTMSDIRVLGHGYDPGMPTWRTVHNIPLIVVDQIGPVAGVAWLFVTLYCLVRTKWKYAFMAVLSMSVFDHYLWSQFAFFWPVLVGMSTADKSTGSDLIFRRAE